MNFTAIIRTETSETMIKPSLSFHTLFLSGIDHGRTETLHTPREGISEAEIAVLEKRGLRRALAERARPVWLQRFVDSSAP